MAGTDGSVSGVPQTPPTDYSNPTAKKQRTMGMQDFLKIMAAQMKNQSLENPTDNSQYITEMTLFSAIQAMNTQTSEANKQYGSSLIGNDVLIKTLDKATGDTKSFTGTVSKAVFNSSSGDCAIQIGNTLYNLSDVAEVYGYHNTNTAADRQYAASLVGKMVEVQTTDSDGVVQKVLGTVQNVSFDPATGTSTIMLPGNHPYNVSDVTQVYGNQGVDTAAVRQYAASLVGKTVEVQTTDSDGVVHKEDGIVQSVSLSPNSGIAMINFDNNHTYNVSDVIEVLKT